MEHADTEESSLGICRYFVNRLEETTMAKRATIEVNGVVYRKSSWSDSGQLCVGVAFQNNDVLVINTNTQDPVLRFTKEEWRAFLAGVKANEFDAE